MGGWRKYESFLFCRHYKDETQFESSYTRDILSLRFSETCYDRYFGSVSLAIYLRLMNKHQISNTKCILL